MVRLVLGFWCCVRAWDFGGFGVSLGGFWVDLGFFGVVVRLLLIKH